MAGNRPCDVPFHVILGSGRTMVVAGGIHLDHAYLRPWLDPLAETVRLVYYDHRGTGRSADGSDPSELGHSVWLEDIERLRTAVGADRIVLFGHSYGGFLAQEYALAHPDWLEGLILCSTAPALDYPEVVMANAEAAGSPEIVEAVRQVFSVPVADDSALHRLWTTLLPLYFHRYDAEVAAETARRSTYSAAAFNRAFFECLPDFCMVGRLNGLQLPALLLVGRYDWICPPEQGAMRIQRELPHAELVVFEESGHFPFIEERERFVSTVARWVDSLPGG
ncbi:MAG: alpha/beta fold hydrolase [Gemmatimonadota bacterium]